MHYGEEVEAAKNYFYAKKYKNYFYACWTLIAINAELNSKTRIVSFCFSASLSSVTRGRIKTMSVQLSSDTAFHDVWRRFWEVRGWRDWKEDGLKALLSWRILSLDWSPELVFGLKDLDSTENIEKITEWKTPGKFMEKPKGSLRNWLLQKQLKIVEIAIKQQREDGGEHREDRGDLSKIQPLFGSP
jgi:hypothetical protein